jgi:hypothetical protein
MAVRMATRIGLHRDGAQFGLSPFETEQRRRLWWQIVAIDKRVAEITGSPISALSSMATDCRYPLNVNDSDLHPQSKGPPLRSSGITEMTFSLTRFEITVASAPDGIRPNPKAPSYQNDDSPTPDSSNQKSSSKISENLDRYCNHMEATYLKHCDTKIPLQLFTLLMTRVSLHKLKVLDFVCQGTSPDPEHKRQDAAFLAAVHMLEADNTIHSTPSLSGLIWYSHMHIPLPGYIFLANELRHRTTGELCERIWDAICQSPYLKGLSRNLRSPLHVALGQTILKAWDARERVELDGGKVLQAPNIIVSLREVLPDHRAREIAGRDMARTTVEAENGSTSSSLGRVENIMSSENMLLDSMAGISDMAGSSSSDYNQLFWTNLMQAGAFGGFWEDSDYTLQ